jgi:hypothetical protein
LVWVNPPNRVNYTVIRRVRNVRRYASPKCSTKRDSKRRGKVQFPSSEHQGKSDLKRFNIQTREHPVGALEILWNLDFGTWNFPANRKFREAGLLA